MSKYYSDKAFCRLMLLISTLLQYPGVGYLHETDDEDQHRNALDELRQYVLLIAKDQGIELSCSTHTLHKDLAFLRSVGILGNHMYRWGYYLGTGAMSESELMVALNALNSQAHYQRDPLVQDVYNKLVKRLKGLKSKDQIFYPVRAQLNRSIVETSPIERAAQMTGDRNLFDCLGQVEAAILKGQQIELSRKSDPVAGRGYQKFQVWPLQILHYDIAWYLIHQDSSNGHLAISRIDRLEDRCTVANRQGRKLSEQRRSLEQAHELLTNGWGLFLGEPEEQQQELMGQLELVEVRVRFFPAVMGFIAESALRHPSQRLEPFPYGPLNKKTEYLDYIVKLPPRSLREFSFWVYRFMGNAQVRSPATLVEAHRLAAQQQAALYLRDVQ